MLTIFTIPKPFTDSHINTIQRNAIKSWTLLDSCEIILFGDEEGVAETAKEFEVRHIPKIISSDFGTPLVSEAFKMTRNLAKREKLVYVDADIILMADFMKTIQRINLPSFLMIGRHHGVDIKEPLQFNDSDWENKLRRFTAKYGKLHSLAAMDYFIFPRDLEFNLLPFPVGRPGWDNWLVYRARSMKIPVIDATGVMTVIHQNHSHSYLQGEKNQWEGPESRQSLKLIDDFSKTLTIGDADWILTPKGLKKSKITIRYLPRYFEVLSVLHPRAKFFFRLINQILSPRRMAGKILRKIKLLSS